MRHIIVIIYTLMMKVYSRRLGDYEGADGWAWLWSSTWRVICCNKMKCSTLSFSFFSSIPFRYFHLLSSTLIPITSKYLHNWFASSRTFQCEMKDSGQVSHPIQWLMCSKSIWFIICPSFFLSLFLAIKVNDPGLDAAEMRKACIELLLCR